MEKIQLESAMVDRDFWGSPVDFPDGRANKAKVTKVSKTLEWNECDDDKYSGFMQGPSRDVEGRSDKMSRELLTRVCMRHNNLGNIDCHDCHRFHAWPNPKKNMTRKGIVKAPDYGAWNSVEI